MSQDNPECPCCFGQPFCPICWRDHPPDDEVDPAYRLGGLAGVAAILLQRPYVPYEDTAMAIERLRGWCQSKVDEGASHSATALRAVVEADRALEVLEGLDELEAAAPLPAKPPTA